MAWPTANIFTSGITNGQAKTAQDDWLAMTRLMPGAGGLTTKTIAAGSITPTAARHLVDTEAAAASDDLDTIAQANFPDDGMIVVLSTVSSARDVRVRHGIGGAGQILLADAANFTLSDTSMRLILEKSGTTWVEVGRFLGTAMYSAESVYGYAKGLTQAEVNAGVLDTGYVSAAKLAGWWSNLITTAVTAITGIWTFYKARAKSQVLVDSATVNWDAASGSIASVTWGGNRTMAAPTNLTTDMFYMLIGKNDATGGRVPTWNSVFKWKGGSAPAGSTSANAVDYYIFYSPDGTNLHEIGHNFDVK